jgi:phage-related protein
MADKFGLKLGIEGEKEFKRALSDINASFKVLGSEMKLVESQFGKNNSSVESLTARNQVLGKEIEAQKSKIETLRSALGNAAESFGENDRRTQNWQIQLNNAEAALNDMERELDENKKALDQADMGMDDAAKDAGKLGEKVDKSGDSAEEAADKFSGFKSALAGVGAAMGAVVAAAGAAAVSLGKEVIAAYADYEQLVGGLDTLFKDSSQEMQRYAANAYKTAGMSANDYMETVTGFSASLISSLGGDTEKAAKIADMAIIDMSDNANKMGSDIESIRNAYQGFAKGQFNMLDNLKLGYGGTKTEMERLLKDAEAISGIHYDLDSYADVVSAIHVIQEEMDIAGTTAKEADATISGSISSLQAAWQNLIVGFGDANADMATLCENVAEAFRTVVANITPVVENIVKALPEAVGTLMEAFTDLLPLLLSTVADLFTEVLSTLVGMLPQLIPVVVEAILTIVNALIENLPLIIAGAIQLVNALLQGIGQALPTLVPAIVQAVVTIAQTLIDNLPTILDAALQIVTGLAQGILDALPVLIEALPAIITGIVDFVLGAIPQIIDAGIQLLTSLVGALPDIITAIVEAIPQIIDGVIGAVLDAIPLIIQAGIDLLVALIQALPEIITTIITAIPQIISGIVNALIGNIDKIIAAGVQLLVALVENLPVIIVELVKAIPKIIEALLGALGSFVGSFAEMGLNLLKGLWNGISDAAAWLWEKISGFFGGIVDKIKNFFGIHSPSTLFADMGGNMAEGLGKGFGEEMNSVGDTMTEATAAAGDVTGKTAITAVAKGLLDNMNLLDKPISQLVSHMGEMLSEGLPEFVSTAMDLNGYLAEGLASSEQSVIDPLLKLIEAIRQAFASAKDGFVQIGQMIMEGIGQGITNRSTWLKNLLSNYVNQMKRQVQSMLGIHSPSKVFAEIGGHMAEGMGVGFAREMTAVRKQITDSIPRTLEAPEATRSADVVNGIVGGLSAAIGNGSKQPIVLQGTLVSRVIAQTIFDPLRSVAVQRGVAYG